LALAQHNGTKGVYQDMIETERLILRKMKEDDAESLLDIFSDPIAMRYFGVIFDRRRMGQWVRNNLEHEKLYGFSLLSVILKSNGEVIGDCGLETDEIEGRIDPQNAPSQRVAEKIGMSVERYVTRGSKKYALYSIKRKDWNRNTESHHE
jgi:RimJ/RimL family protein N-acetyltransferase